MHKLLPACESKERWQKLFGEISQIYRSHFREVSAIIYMSEDAFYRKQESFVNNAMVTA